jgi:multidrug efflux pump subunit AcrB
VDRARAAYLGISQQDASTALLAALGSGGTVAPNFWADPANGSSYDVQIQAPPSDLTSAEQLLNLPVRPSAGGEPVLLRTFASILEQRAPASVSRTTLLPTLTLVANVQGRDLGSVTKDLNVILGELREKQKAKPGNKIELNGQAALMESAYGELIGGLGLAAVLVFLVMVVNFQSWSLPFVAISGLPLAVAGALAALAIVTAAYEVWLGVSNPTVVWLTYLLIVHIGIKKRKPNVVLGTTIVYTALSVISWLMAIEDFPQYNFFDWMGTLIDIIQLALMYLIYVEIKPRAGER